MDQCFIVAGVPTDINGIKDWDPNVYSISQGAGGSLVPKGDEKELAIKNGKPRIDVWVSAHSSKWILRSGDARFDLIMNTVYPRPVYNMTFLGYVRLDVNATKEGKLIY